MINRINLNTMSFRGNKVQPKSKYDTKKPVSNPQKEKNLESLVDEHMALKEEMERVHKLIADTRKNNPYADVSLYYAELGKMINKQDELKTIIENSIKDNLRKNGI